MTAGREKRPGSDPDPADRSPGAGSGANDRQGVNDPAKAARQSGSGSAEAVGPGEPDHDDAVPLEVTDALDLHAFHPRDLVRVVADYLDEAAARGFVEVRLIHGKGIGLQRERVRQLLARHPRVAAFQDAPPDRGHWGATLVRLFHG
jgi:hypothetical protein